MKKTAACLLVLLLAFAAVCAAADGNGEEYVIACYNDKCPGYCYVYDKPDSTNGRSLGRMNNGTPVTVYNYISNDRGGWYYISGCNTKGNSVSGYIHWYSAEPAGSAALSVSIRDMVIDCSDPACPGYCRVYETPDSVNGRDLGRMDNGTSVTVYDSVSNGAGTWYRISGFNTKGQFIYGYIRDFSARPA